MHERLLKNHVTHNTSLFQHISGSRITYSLCKSQALHLTFLLCLLMSAHYAPVYATLIIHNSLWYSCTVQLLASLEVMRFKFD